MHALVLASALTLPAAPAESEIPLWQLRMFPDRKCALGQWNFWDERIRQISEWKKDGMIIPLSWDTEALEAREAWYVLLEAQDSSNTPRYRHGRLSWLRLRLGEKDFWEGRMPLPVPQHFWEIEYRDGQWQWCERR